VAVGGCAAEEEDLEWLGRGGHCRGSGVGLEVWS